MPFSVSQRALERLEWPEILARLAEHARTPHGRQSITAGDTCFASSVETMRERLAQTREARAILEAGDAPPLDGAAELAHPLAHARKGGALEADDLRRVAASIAALGSTRRFHEQRAELAPGLAVLAEHIEPCAALGAEIEGCIDESGDVRNDASQALAAARRDTRRLSGEIQSRVAQLLQSREVQPHLTDNWSTVRNDRTVLPVRSDARRAVPGIVHDASRTGATLFIEPEVLIELNNRHREAELLADQEVRRVLRELSRGVTDAAPSIAAGLALLGQIDFAFARAAYARALDAVEPTIGEGGVLALAQLRHPLIPPDESVPNDVRLGEGFSVLVLSGPNAGGKTVTMKAAALALLFTRAGLFVPAQAPARVDAFDALLADIGDEQDIREHLSTFSAHMANLAKIVERANAHSLVILDELGVGTDPGEGAAIAQAALESLADAGARVFVTTHYGLLKEIAEVDERFANACVEFDPETLAPTYRLHMGLPGISSAAAVAARMGMPRAVLARADTLLSRDDRQLDRMLAELAANRASLEREQAEARRLRAESETVRHDYSVKLEKLRERRQQLYHELRADLDRAFREAHGQIAGVIRDLQSGATSRDAARARERLLALEQATDEAEAQSDLRPPPPPADPFDWKRARPGDRVSVREAGSGVLTTLPDRKGRVTVQLGTAKVVVSMERIAKASDASSNLPAPRFVSAPPLPPGGSSHLDLRGLRVDEALDRLGAALDEAAAAGRQRLEIVHGIGTGALRAAVREHLADSPYVARVVAAEANEGGDGVTFAELDLS
ncbi:MAG: endonuclease MutS2 [Deltaproteobacteria bacterium]|nr:endonuclease MutS2 [Deltaproteobacteria bacterium]